MKNVYNCNYFVGKRLLSTDPIQVGKTKLDLPEGVARLMVKIDTGKWQCKGCNDGIIHTKSSNLRAHIEANHYTPGYKCEICNRMMKSRNAYRSHMKIKHGLS